MGKAGRRAGIAAVVVASEIVIIALTPARTIGGVPTAIATRRKRHVDMTITHRVALVVFIVVIVHRPPHWFSWFSCGSGRRATETIVVIHHHVVMIVNEVVVMVHGPRREQVAVTIAVTTAFTTRHGCKSHSYKTWHKLRDVPYCSTLHGYLILIPSRTMRDPVMTQS